MGTTIVHGRVFRIYMIIRLPEPTPLYRPLPAMKPGNVLPLQQGDESTDSMCRSQSQLTVATC